MSEEKIDGAATFSFKKFQMGFGINVISANTFSLTLILKVRVCAYTLGKTLSREKNANICMYGNACIKTNLHITHVVSLKAKLFLFLR